MSELTLLTATELARLLNVSLRHVWQLHGTGRLPKPVRLGRSVRWPRHDVIDWIDSGCPRQDACEQPPVEVSQEPMGANVDGR